MRSRLQKGRRSVAVLATALSLTWLGANAALAAACPTVADPGKLVGAFPQQAEIDEAAAAGITLTYSDNPLFAADVAAGKLPPVKDRLPEQPLIELPYEACGVYGGTLEGTSRAPTSGTSDILSWRQTVLVRMSDDLKTVVPDVARSWKWNDDYTAVTFELRKGHKWSDGQPFTADDVVFFFEDIIQNKDLSPNTTAEWGVNPHAKAIDPTHVQISFDAPDPGLLTYMATSGSYFSTFAPRHFFEKFMPKYNPNADADAKKAGFDDWKKWFANYYQKWHDDGTVTAAALEVPTLEAMVVEQVPDTQQRVFKANPYYFKVDSSGQQLPYFERTHERFLTADLQVLAILNGEVDFKAQGNELENYPTLKDGEDKGHYKVQLPEGAIGTDFAFNITHADPKLRAVYSDLRFRQAVSMAINRDEMNQVMYFGLGQPSQALPADTSFVTAADENYMIEYSPDKANALLDDMGMKKGADGFRTFPDGSPFTILWQYSSQFAGPEFVKLMSDYLKAVGLNVNAKEVTSEATRDNSKAGISDINMEWDVPYEPTLVANIDLYVPYYSDISPLFGVKWKQWYNSNGKEGEEPPDWARKMFDLAKEWKTVLPGSDRYMEIGRELVKLNLENMTIIGTIGALPKPVVVTDKLHNISAKLGTVHYNFGYMYPYRPDQWYKQ
ncbi:MULTISPECIES: ABC transporter substrate-binding protein [unclassified Devosia]|uniref:ABC transporter substrate-binding protein n=1 Tax=unclassified Devosia TaxID=196773 RepID=UPI001AD59804|nr:MULTISPECIES: ABC transporter substrate-binding protein [unclassified Devosia]MBN9306520.1 ABC transporter substrate-binding protein [Devosia sp.]